MQEPPKTILFVHNSNDLYGADIVLFNLIEALDRKEFRPIVVLPKDVRHIGRLSVKLEAIGIPCRFLALGVLRRRYLTLLQIGPLLVELVRATAVLCALIRREKVDIIHTNTLTVLASPFAARLMNRPHIWHIHEIIPGSTGPRKVLHWMVTHLSSRIVAVSNAVRGHILLDQPKKACRIETIHNGIDLSLFLPRGCDRETVRNELNIPDQALVIGMIGRVSGWKGQSMFAEASSKISTEHPELYFVAVGGTFDHEQGPMATFRKQVESLQLKNFRICDYRRDVPAVLRAFDIFVLPSTLPDPFPTVVMEAMAAGLPVIAADGGGVPEMVIPELTGILVPPGDADALASAIRRLIRDDSCRAAMGETARRQAETKFQFTRFVRQFECTYRSVMKSV
jgi:glycosyltransferase involved in cell wall biosynthesis